MDQTADLIARVLPSHAIDDAVIDAIVLSACADGMTKEELETLAKMVRDLPTLSGKDDGAVTERIRESFERVQRDGLDGRLRALSDTAMDGETRRRIFCAATIIQYADGRVTNEENEFLLDLADVLGLSETMVREIVSEIETTLGVDEHISSQRIMTR
jgi:tellurite resistance protein